ncbi:Mov34/MPN/PAD-1 family protein [Longitalea arenae]|uniref:Mov34/MPN/PAD-1 family protein n=1 Tax=Longitalea arenae TaxID=2812558 RepID=UPI001967190D|nr:ThiF family adenylyltransferase [Longitalea arenae]
MLYSADYQPFRGVLPDSVKECIAEIIQYFGNASLPVLRLDEDHIVVPVSFHVPLPTRGALGGIDIREIEPMLIKISLSEYPHKMPMLLSDRKNFPHAQLPHLYVKRVNQPASLCLVRNSPNEWFANKRMSDLLSVGLEWLQKAGMGKLADDNNEFDPTRLENFYGTHVYKYNTLHETVKDKVPFIKGLPASVLMGWLDENDEFDSGYYSAGPIPYVSLPDTRDALRSVTEKMKTHKRKFMFSLVVWRDDGQAEESYSTSLPENFAALKLYFTGRGIDIIAILNAYMKLDLQFLNGILITFANRRPKKMVGYDGPYEFTSFIVNAGNFATGKCLDDAQVWTLQHIEPFTKELGARLSGENREEKTLYIGGGSLGSKMIMHEARSGNTDIKIIDHDKLLQHNLARHTLSREHVGRNKAKAIVTELESLYVLQDTAFKAHASRIDQSFDKVEPGYSRIVDTSASLSALNFLTTATLPPSVILSKCEIADDGRLGFLYTEGNNRNPRIDDLVSLTFFRSLTNPHLAGWRERDMHRVLTTLDVGLGCSSTTTVMPDDTISLHASAFSRVLYKNTGNAVSKGEGLLYMNICEEEDLLSLSSKTELVKPFNVLMCAAGSGWSVRIMAGIQQQLWDLCRQKAPTETGGVLIGLANYKTKTIHVFDIIVEPQGSKGSCTGFERGTKGLPEAVDQIKERSGNTIGYIGEWHSHPMDLEKLSAQDIATIEELKKINRKIPIPTCAFVVTNTKLLAFVFE